MERIKMQGNSTILEITVISAEELRLSHRPLKKNAFVIVRSGPLHDGMSTSLDRNGGSYPHWNEKLQMALPASVHSITVEVRCKTVSGDRLVAAAAVPVSDFCQPADYLHLLSYRLRERDGGRNGIINLSVKLKDASPDLGCGVRPPPAVPPMIWTRDEARDHRVAMGYPLAYGYRV